MDAIAVCDVSHDPLEKQAEPSNLRENPPPAASLTPQTPQPMPLPSVPAPAAGPTDSVPIAVTDGSKATVDVTLGSTIVNFTIDTGAEVMSLPKIIANGLIADGSASEAGTTSIKVADGRIIEERRIIIDRLQIGTHVLRDVVATVPDNDGAMLLLPFTVLNQMGKFTIDTANGRLIFG
jgi:predicted aspartyl protease